MRFDLATEGGKYSVLDKPLIFYLLDGMSNLAMHIGFDV